MGSWTYFPLKIGNVPVSKLDGFPRTNPPNSFAPRFVFRVTTHNCRLGTAMQMRLSMRTVNDQTQLIGSGTQTAAEFVSKLVL